MHVTTHHAVLADLGIRICTGIKKLDYSVQLRSCQRRGAVVNGGGCGACSSGRYVMQACCASTVVNAKQ